MLAASYGLIAALAVGAAIASKLEGAWLGLPAALVVYYLVATTIYKRLG